MVEIIIRDLFLDLKQYPGFQALQCEQGHQLSNEYYLITVVNALTFRDQLQIVQSIWGLHGSALDLVHRMEAIS